MNTPRICYRSCELDSLQTLRLKLTIVISAELELTVSLLVQIDKLVMLIESPVFTSQLRRTRLCLIKLRLRRLETAIVGT